MIKWIKNTITRETGELVEAQFPMIISASRSTDIPAFYAPWFFNRLKLGYSAWINPWNKEKTYVGYQETRFIVFWSKNPKPLLPYIGELEKRGIGFYIQYTLNDYEKEGLEKGVPELQTRIDTFKALVDRCGPGKVIWRFDPLILTDKISIQDLLWKIKGIGDQLKGYTEKLVFSFADIQGYKKVKENLWKSGINYIELDENSEDILACGLEQLNKDWGYTLATCGEKIDLSKYEVCHNKCVDDELITRISWQDQELMNFIGIEIKTGLAPENAILIDSNTYGIRTKNLKDMGQRSLCGCIVSKDIGQYNTCAHMCEYCYANSDKLEAIKNYRKHNDNGETII